MTALQPLYSPEETARRGREIYDRDLRASLEPVHRGDYAAIDIETGAYEVDKDDYTATENLLARQPKAQMWLVRVGHSTTYRIGGPRSDAKSRLA